MESWTHEEKLRVPTRGGWDVTVEFIRDGTGDKRICTFFFLSENSISISGPARMVQKKYNYEISWSALNNFDWGDDGVAKEVLIKLIKAIRNNPNLTIQQSITWFNNNYPDSLYDGAQLLKKMRTWLIEELGFEPTWNQFKTYVINNIFESVD